jgi:hypothetical protein
MINNGSSCSCANPTSGTAATVAAAAPFLDPNQLTLCVTVNQTTSNGVVQSTQVNVTATYPFSFMIAPAVRRERHAIRGDAAYLLSNRVTG